MSEVNLNGRTCQWNINYVFYYRSSGPISYGFASLEVEDAVDNSPPSHGSGPPSLQNELQTIDTAQETDAIVTTHQVISILLYNNIQQTMIS